MYSQEDDFQKHLCDIRLQFKKRASLDQIQDEEVGEVRFFNCEKKKKSQKRKDTKGVSFVITDHPMLPQCESMTVLLKETLIGCMLTMK